MVPANAEGPDERRAVDLELPGGERVTEHVAATNHSTRPVTFTVAANDGYLTDKGLFDVRAADVAPTDGGSWIDVPDTVTVPGGGTAVVPVAVIVPEHATPGDHPAGVTASLDTVSGQVRVRNRVGVRVNTRVTGEARAALAVTDLQATYEPSWNPFAAGALTVRYAVANHGNAHAAADTGITTSHPFGGDTRTDQATARAREVLPGGEAVRDPPHRPVAPRLLLLAFVVLAGRTARAARRRRHHLERLIARAKAEGRAEAAGARQPQEPNSKRALATADPHSSTCARGPNRVVRTIRG
ncbi:hypothetical protein [Saccharothrix sp. HUAS TT1]|uniref:hypothetical protein n=1 Tax=unclassified Saccharothrix TaxID=2593673 RepID=UPI00345C022C